MASPSKAKGNRFEREIVNTVLSSGFNKCKRAWGSNGAALGMHDCLLYTSDAADE